MSAGASWGIVVGALVMGCGGGGKGGDVVASPHEGGGGHGHGHGHAHGGTGHFEHRFEDAASWSKVFDDPERDAWQKPEEVIAALKLDPRARVADIGAGTGYFTMRLARRVPQGKVFGVDVEPDMVRWLGERAQKEGLGNVVAVRGTAASAELPEPVDVVLVVDTYHHIPDRTAFFGRLRSSIREGGRLAIVDFTLAAEMGPPKKHRLPPDEVARELEAAGYRRLESHAFLPNQYFVVFGLAK